MKYILVVTIVYFFCNSYQYFKINFAFTVVFNLALPEPKPWLHYCMDDFFNCCIADYSKIACLKPK